MGMGVSVFVSDFSPVKTSSSPLFGYQEYEGVKGLWHCYKTAIGYEKEPSLIWKTS
jgi:hypothetical protein